jgi:hypothetical protein
MFLAFSYIQIHTDTYIEMAPVKLYCLQPQDFAVVTQNPPNLIAFEAMDAKVFRAMSKVNGWNMPRNTGMSCV